MKFIGNIDKLRKRLDECGDITTERLLPNGGHQFVFVSRAVVNWWPRSGLLEFKGPKEEKFEVVAKYVSVVNKL